MLRKFGDCDGECEDSSEDEQSNTSIPLSRSYKLMWLTLLCLIFVLTVRLIKHFILHVTNVGPAFFYTKPFVDNSEAICLIVIKLYIILFRVPQFTVESSRLDAQKFLRYRRIKNTSLLSSLCACFCAAVVT